MRFVCFSLRHFVSWSVYLREGFFTSNKPALLKPQLNLAVVCYPSFGLAIVCSFIDLWLQGMYGGFSFYLRSVLIWVFTWVSGSMLLGFVLSSATIDYGRRFCFVLAGSLYFCVPKYALWTVMAYEVLYCQLEIDCL